MSSDSARLNKGKRPTASTIEEAVREVIEKGQSINKTAFSLSISRAYLAKIVKKVKSSGESCYKHNPNIGNKRVFTIEQEGLLADYLKTASKMCYGLTRLQTKKLAFDYAEANSVCPENWKDSQSASDDWLKGFMSRNKELSVRKPESTSLSRATSFNKTNVNAFFENLTNVFTRYNFPPHMIFNADETGCSTVTNPPKVIAERGSKQIGQVTSGERGTLVTTLFFVNAAGGFLPPIIVFPRVNYKDIMLANGPPGGLGLANISGWMNEECFIKALEHFVVHVKPSKENPALIIMDNHSSHINLRVVRFARENSIVIVTFPPHCSHKLQPLDVAVYGPFKVRYRVVMNEWMLSNPGKTVTIYHVGHFIKDAYLSAFCPHNITQGFFKTGIYPLNSEIFDEEEFLSSFVTDRSDPSVETEDYNNNGTEIEKNLCRPSSPGPSPGCASSPARASSPAYAPSPACASSQPVSSPDSLASISTHLVGATSGHLTVSPQIVRPFSKAGPRKNTVRKKPKMSSAIITDTPEKNKIEEKDASQKRKKVNKMVTKKAIKALNKKADNDTNNQDQDNCVVCNKNYNTSSQEWYQCKICSGWAHVSCGVKGRLHYFCNECF